MRRKDSVRLLLLILVTAFLTCIPGVNDLESVKDPYAFAYEEVANRA